MSALAPIVSDAPTARTRRIGPPEPLGQNAARHLVRSQGEVWLAKGKTASAAVHATLGDRIDARGDPMRARIWALLHRIAAEAKTRGAYEIHADAAEAIGLAERYEEIDRHLDDHRAECGRAAGEAVLHLARSCKTHAELLAGKAEEDEA